MSVKGVMVKTDVNSLKKTATTNIPVWDVEKEDTGRSTAPLKAIRNVGYGMMPKYLQYNLWDLNSYFSPNTIDWTKTALLLWDPPTSKFNNPEVATTIRENPGLFKTHEPPKPTVCGISL